jgi:hypothetical protein
MSFRSRFHLTPILCMCLAFLFASSFALAADTSAVKVWEEKAVIPTMEIPARTVQRPSGLRQCRVAIQL